MLTHLKGLDEPVVQPAPMNHHKQVFSAAVSSFLSVSSPRAEALSFFPKSLSRCVVLAFQTAFSIVPPESTEPAFYLNTGSARHGRPPLSRLVYAVHAHHFQFCSDADRPCLRNERSKSPAGMVLSQQCSSCRLRDSYRNRREIWY